MKNMKISLKQLIKETQGMTPVQFEEYCKTNKILTEWMEVCITDFNDGYYNVTLPYYNDIDVYSYNGSPIQFNDL